MTSAAEKETIIDPFTVFNFRVELYDANSNEPLCSAGFAECSGLEISMAPKSYQEGGLNARQHHFIGPVSYGQLTLKRGMTGNFDLWTWFSQTMQKNGGGLRASGQIVLFAEDGSTERARFSIDGCLPVKLVAPALNAKDGHIAIEEMQLVYASLTLLPPSGGGR